MANVKSLPIRELERYVGILSRRTGRDYSIDRAYGGYRLARDGGAKMVSPRLTKQEFTVYLDACIAMVDELGVSPNPGRKVREAPTGRKVYASHERHGHLTTSGRRALSRKDFALPPGPEEKRRGIKGRLPIEDADHARAALSRASMMHHRGELTKKQLQAVQRKIQKRYPDIDVTVTNPPSTRDLVAAYIGDGYLYGASGDPGAADPHYWLQLREEHEPYSLYRLHDVPFDLATKLEMQGTSEQAFADGYVAAMEAAPYADGDPFYEYDTGADFQRVPRLYGNPGDRARLIETQEHLMEELWRESEKEKPDRVRLRGLWKELHELNDRIVREFSGPVRRPPMHKNPPTYLVTSAIAQIEDIADRAAAHGCGEEAGQLHGLAKGMASQLERERRYGPNPPGDRGHLQGQVIEIKYRHAEDGKYYKHEFGKGDELRTLPDGSLRIVNPRRKLWRDFP